MKIKDGKDLEEFAAGIERLYLPDGFRVCSRSVNYIDGGVAANEFDIEITGRIGTHDVRWVIECRDRPGQRRKQGIGWVEQLIGRKQDHRLDKLIAVSSTGFSEPAKLAAARHGIELRTVKELGEQEVASWLPVSRHHVVHRSATLLKIVPTFFKEQTVRQRVELKGAEIKLRSSRSGEVIRPEEAFCQAVDLQHLKVDQMLASGENKEISLLVKYDPEDYMLIDTLVGALRVAAIEFIGTVQESVIDLPLSGISQYTRGDEGEVLAETATYEAHVPGTSNAEGFQLRVGLHRLGDGKMALSMKRPGAKKGDTPVRMRVTTRDEGTSAESKEGKE